MATKKKTTATKAKSSPKTSVLGKQEKMWQIESALDTLKRAEQIKKDPKMMSEVKKLAEQQVGMLKNLTGGKV